MLQFFSLISDSIAGVNLNVSLWPFVNNAASVIPWCMYLFNSQKEKKDELKRRDYN